MKYISRKTLLLSLFGVLVALGGVFVLLGDTNLFKSTFVFEKSDDDDAREALAKIIIKDSDGDGLRDWEEALWKTDPQNKDSDGDGTPDGEEVREGRDPTKPGPQDKIELTDKYKQADGKEIETVTGTLINQILSYTSAQKSGGLDVKTKEEFDIFLAQEIKQSTSIAISPRYSVDDLTIVNVNTIEQFAKYKKELESILKKYSNLYTETEFDIIASVIENEDETILNKLDPYINTYKQLVNDLLVIKVPSDVELLHLEFTNEYEKLINSVINMKNGVIDPIRNFVGIAGYQESAVKITEIYIELFNKVNNRLNL